jgi:hypothetical protein
METEGNMTETNMANLYGKKSKDQIKYEGQMISDKVLKKGIIRYI